MLQWVYHFGLEDSVVTIDEICNGDETSGTGNDRKGDVSFLVVLF